METIKIEQFFVPLKFKNDPKQLEMVVLEFGKRGAIHITFISQQGHDFLRVRGKPGLFASLRTLGWNTLEQLPPLEAKILSFRR